MNAQVFYGLFFAAWCLVLCLIPENWMIERDTPREMVVVHRVSEQTKTILKKEEE